MTAICDVSYVAKRNTNLAVALSAKASLAEALREAGVSASCGIGKGAGDELLLKVGLRSEEDGNSVPDIWRGLQVVATYQGEIVALNAAE